eukprot:6475821-Amphidinium_carterae.1
MPHVSVALADVLRQALRDTRERARTIFFSEWVGRLGSLYKESSDARIVIVDSTSGNSDDLEVESNKCVVQGHKTCDVAVGDSDSEDCNMVSAHMSEASASKALAVSLPYDEYGRITQALSEYGVPMTRSRTNLGTCRSQLFGLFTKRGVGVTNMTQTRPEVMKLLHELGKTRHDPT